MKNLPCKFTAMSRIIKFVPVLAACMLSLPLMMPAQTTFPLGETAPQGNVLRAGHLGRHIGDVERIIHFYHDTLGLGLQGQRNEERRFFTTPGLLEFANTPDYAEFRAVIMPIPGTAAEAGKNEEMTIEAIEFRNMDRRQWVMGIQDIGSSHLVLMVRNLDSALEKLKAIDAYIVTPGGKPVEVTPMYGSGKERSIVVRDPDGYPVRLVELTPTPATTAPADSNIIGARISVTVDDLEASEALYTSIVGPELKFRNSPSFTKNEAYNQLWNTPGVEYRYGAALIPGSPVYLEFVQFRGIEQKRNKPILQDIGGAHVLFMAQDADIVMERMNAAGMKTVALSNKPVYIGPTAPALFTQEMNNFFFEFICRSPVQKPAAPK